MKIQKTCMEHVRDLSNKCFFNFPQEFKGRACWLLAAWLAGWLLAGWGVSTSLDGGLGRGKGGRGNNKTRATEHKQ